MKIRKLQLKNIGVFDDEEIEFKECEFNKGKEIKDRKAEIHILTGENGSGKTTILQALASSYKHDLNPHTEVTAFEEDIHNGINILETHNKISKNEFNKKFRFFEFDGKETCKSFVRIFNEKKQELAEVFGCPSCKTVHVLETNILSKLSLKKNPLKESLRLGSAAFTYSGYRRIKDEPIEIGKDNSENPLYQALDFIKDENSKFNVNQWLGQNLLNSSLAQTKKKLDEAKIFDEKIKRFEKVINDIIADETKDNEIRFEMQSATKLVLIKNEQELDFDVLPDGLKSLISWIGDLLMRLDSLKWKDDTPIFDREIILFLDEIEVHLHPAWQRKVLPIIQKLFKNAQIFVSTHSPFVVNSVDDAWVYKLKVDEHGKAHCEEPIESENSNSITQVLREVFGIEQWFGLEVQNTFEDFKKLKHKLISNGTDEATEIKFLETARSLADEPNDQLKQMVRKELEELSEIKKKTYTL
jgi:predicted ATP-binding protein involved in virulence